MKFQPQGELCKCGRAPAHSPTDSYMHPLPTTEPTGRGSSPESPQTEAVTAGRLSGTDESRPGTRPKPRAPDSAVYEVSTDEPKGPLPSTPPAASSGPSAARPGEKWREEVMRTWEVGDTVRFSWHQNQLLVGVILDSKRTLFGGIKYRIAYGVGSFGYKISDAETWVGAKDIFPLLPLITGRETLPDTGRLLGEKW